MGPGHAPCSQRLASDVDTLRIMANSDQTRFPVAIARQGLSIYDPIEPGNPELWIPSAVLEEILDEGLRGMYLGGMPLRTRSKAVKERVCCSLGYEVPKSFRRTRPRFPGQDLDVYTQKSDNLQIWNEDVSACRRYLLVRVSSDDVVTGARVVDGHFLERLDSTGTLTGKYQARCVAGPDRAELVTLTDTDLLQPLTTTEFVRSDDPTRAPEFGKLMSIATVFDLIRPLVGLSLPRTGLDQERNRGALLHGMVCRALMYPGYRDDGRFPDVRHQLLEVKLQTSPTIDLGLVCPSSRDPLGGLVMGGHAVRHCDVRYLIVCGEGRDPIVITHVLLSTGEGFFARFPQFGGRVTNRKLQIRLPNGLFGGQPEGPPH